MSDRPDTLRVFVASPGDVGEEREIVSLVVAELRRVFEERLPLRLDAIRWETHGWPDIGDDAQDVINKQVGEFDILVGIMWRRFGTPTRRARSGTDEEFQRAYRYFHEYGRPRVMFYFRTAPFYTTDLQEITQFRKVVKFRKELESKGVLFWEYDRPIDFERNVREHLIRQILPLVVGPGAERAEKPTKKLRKRKAKRRKYLIEPRPPAIARPSVFVAYAREDRPAVKNVYEDLRIAGFDPWLDTENLLPGQMWHKEVRGAIRNADGIVLCLSSQSVSKRGFFQSELQAALEAQASRVPGSLYLIPCGWTTLLSRKHSPSYSTSTTFGPAVPNSWWKRCDRSPRRGVSRPKGKGMPEERSRRAGRTNGIERTAKLGCSAASASPPLMPKRCAA